MLQDRSMIKAVSGIHQRSERQQDNQKVENTFVDVGLLPQIDNTNNQIIYGRRGTGKTHLFRVFENRLNERGGVCVLNIDMRTLGSSSLFLNTDNPLALRCTNLFNDILNEIHWKLLDYIQNNPNSQSQLALSELHEFSRIANEPVVTFVPEKLNESQTQKSAGAAGLGFELKQEGPSAKAEFKSDASVEKKVDISSSIKHESKVKFPDLHFITKSVLTKSNAKLYLLLDEWSSIPLDIQPYLAEFLKRSFIALPEVIIKIASLEYRSNFLLRSGHELIGLELGGDISTSVDIDDYYVYDRAPLVVIGNFSDILFRHLKSELSEGYLESTYGVDDDRTLTQKIFTTPPTFTELVRASEGVVRDFINIFSIAFFDSQRKGRDNIDHKSVLEAARQWFEQDKARNLDEPLHIVLKRIIDEVIGYRRARSFLLPRDLEGNGTVQKLFDARILHLMQRGYADKDNPGTRYNIYTLDYGTYVNLKNTSREPDIDMVIPENREANNGEFIVPFDDKRSIRRIILAKEVLETE